MTRIAQKSFSAQKDKTKQAAPVPWLCMKAPGRGVSGFHPLPRPSEAKRQGPTQQAHRMGSERNHDMEIPSLPLYWGQVGTPQKEIGVDWGPRVSSHSCLLSRDVRPISHCTHHGDWPVHCSRHINHSLTQISTYGSSWYIALLIRGLWATDILRQTNTVFLH